MRMFSGSLTNAFFIAVYAVRPEHANYAAASGSKLLIFAVNL